MKKHSAHFVVGLLGVFLALPGHASPITDSASYAVNSFIPDNDLNGFSDTQTFSSVINNITDLRVNLSIQGGYNGDLYVYLTHGTGFSVLLNRVGVTGSDPFGYGDAGFNVTFDDTASSDIHTYQLTLDPMGGVLNGIWQPDGRETHPLSVLDTDARTAFLSSFAGLDPNGEWTLFLADVSPVGSSKLISWGIEVTGSSNVPDAGQTSLLLCLSVGLLILAVRRLPHST